MRKLFLAVSALTLCTLAACGRREASVDSPSVSAAIPQPSADTTAPPHRGVTQASAVSDGDGAYGMPRAPIPYNELSAYEQQQQQGRQDPSVQPDQPPAPPRTRMSSKPRSADTVFY